jgi:hypothetical protein
VTSTVKETLAEEELVLPALSLAVAVTEWLPSLKAELSGTVKLQPP